MKDTDWKSVHAALVRLARSKGQYDAEEGRWLLEGVRVSVHQQLGFATFLEYLERLFGYAPRVAKERLRVAEALARLPALAAALSEGALAWSAVRELSRVAVRQTEAEWIGAARGKTVRQVEEMVSGRKAGARPGDPADPGARRVVLHLEISADALAAFRDARRQLELEVGHSLDDDEAVRMLAHHALGGPGEPGRSAYQVAMTVCTECGRGTRDDAGQVLAVEPHRVEAALCDAQEVALESHVGLPPGPAATASQTIASHVGLPPGSAAPASQTIPPRIRRLVWRRDHGCCRVPGCRAARYLEVHHVVPRSQGGDHDPSRLLLLCSLCRARHNEHYADRRIMPRRVGLSTVRLGWTRHNQSSRRKARRASSARNRPDRARRGAVRARARSLAARSASRYICVVSIDSWPRSEEHTSELQSLRHLVCRL